MKKIIFNLFLIVFFNTLQSQPNIAKIKIHKLTINDTTYFDIKQFALYSKTSGFDNRFTTLKSCKVQYKSFKKSGEVVLKTNFLPKTLVSKLYNLRVKKIELVFSNIILKADSLNKEERKCPDFSYTILKKRSYWWLIGAGKVFWPIPAYYITNKE